ncbi:hypothetical protein RvY_04203 [Ramazzottius varieornatus]|uniref:Enoyl reductase (ER) domain-containing protein n=1 Tax=Ramazzottius varieornatus TaxID=947166 RepID=A0A1D1UQV3_RAMVA|nr:hypothetical protein RvY_04203 [Ramazzottius varieornatus]
MMNAAANIAGKLFGHGSGTTNEDATMQENTSESTIQESEANLARKMNAVVYHGKGDVRYEKVPKPIMVDTIHGKDALIRVTATSIDGIDVAAYNNSQLLGLVNGDILGHEFMGIVEEVGIDVLLPVGSRVVVSLNISCGECDYCKSKLFSACSKTNPRLTPGQVIDAQTCGAFGLGPRFGRYQGGQAEYVRVPFADVNCLPIPDDVMDEKALLLSNVIPTAYHACRNVREGDVVGIWGMGPVGLCAARWCQVLGAKRIIGISGTEDRLDIARNRLGIDAINYNTDNVTERIAELEQRGLDVAIDAANPGAPKSTSHKLQRALGLEASAPEVITECVMSLRKFGNLTLIAGYDGTINGFPILEFERRHINMTIGLSPTQKLWHYCLSKVVDGTFDPRYVISHYMSLAEAPEAYKKLAAHEDGFIKVFLRPEPPSAIEPGEQPDQVDAYRQSSEARLQSEMEVVDTPMEVQREVQVTETVQVQVPPQGASEYY